MKQEIIARFTLELLLQIDEKLSTDPELEINILTMGVFDLNEALACYDYSRTIENLDRISVSFCGEDVSFEALVATAGFNPENRMALPHCQYKHDKLNSYVYGDRNRILSQKEAAAQIKTAFTSILTSVYDLPVDYLDNESKPIPAIESPFFVDYNTGANQVPVPMPEPEDDSIVKTEEGDEF